jgi:hypothetical protein
MVPRDGMRKARSSDDQGIERFRPSLRRSEVEIHVQLGGSPFVQRGCTEGFQWPSMETGARFSQISQVLELLRR